MSAARSTGPNDADGVQRPQATTQPSSSLADAKPGSRHENLNLPHDFGAKNNDTVEVQYASHAALNQDPGRVQVRSNDERDGTRQAGAGSPQGGAGSGSGGDIDPDVVGIGGIGLAASIPDRKERADSIRNARQVPLSHPAKGENQDMNDVGISDQIPRGGTVTYDRDTTADGESRDAGADALRTTDADDPYADAAVGEVSGGESDENDSSSSSSDRNAER